MRFSLVLTAIAATGRIADAAGERGDAKPDGELEVNDFRFLQDMSMSVAAMEGWDGDGHSYESKSAKSHYDDYDYDYYGSKSAKAYNYTKSAKSGYDDYDYYYGKSAKSYNGTKSAKGYYDDYDYEYYAKSAKAYNYSKSAKSYYDDYDYEYYAKSAKSYPYNYSKSAKGYYDDYDYEYYAKSAKSYPYNYSKSAKSYYDDYDDDYYTKSAKSYYGSKSSKSYYDDYDYDYYGSKSSKSYYDDYDYEYYGSKSAKSRYDDYDYYGSKSSKAYGAKSKASTCESCPLEPIPVNEEDFGEPDWETILELAFPTWDLEGECPRLPEVKDGQTAADIVNGTAFPDSQEGKWNPCYYTKAFAGLDPALGGYPTPIDTAYPYEFAAPFFRQPGDGSVKHCAVEEGEDPSTVDIGACPKLGACEEKDCAVIDNEYGIGHIPPFVPLAAIKYAYGKCGKPDICSTWFNYPTNMCSIKKSKLDELVYEYFGEGKTIKFQPPILLEGKPSTTYYRLEYGGEVPACDEGICRGPHYCSANVDGQPIWGDFCPYVHTGPNSGKYRHPHLALAALETWIANQCMPTKCAPQWLDTPNGQGYGVDPKTATSITWSAMDVEDFPIAQPKVPYAWPNDGSGIFPGLDTLYDEECPSKKAPGLYVNEVIVPVKLSGA